MSGPSRDGVSDEALAAAAAAGDRGALEHLLERHADRVHAICRRVTGDPHDALDATQEALIALARRIDGFDGRSRFTTWLYRVATNAALDEIRRRGRRPAPLDVGAPDAPAPAATRNFDTAVEARLDVDEALGHLHPDFRAAVVLRDLCDLEYEEIAEVLGVPIGTVRSRIARGRAALAERISSPDAPGGNPGTPRRRPKRRTP